MKRIFKKILLANIFFTIIFANFLFLGGNFAHAGTPAKLNSDILNDTEDRIIDKKITGSNIQNSSLIKTIIPKLFKLMFFLATSLAVLSLVYGGYLMITSLGDDSQHKKGWTIFGYSIVGLVLMLFSRAIVGIVSSIKITKDTVNGLDYSLGQSKYIGNLPSGKLETDVIPQIIQLALQFVSVVIIGIIIYAGIMYIVNPEKNKEQMSSLFINAVIGLIMILTSYVLVAGILKINFG
ncbi:hypothetical protein LR002_01405 [Candidatus Gracilibacteria bacterium]|nr:hypothetical protein [Candidatus Gracilibacteria bacterium]